MSRDDRFLQQERTLSMIYNLPSKTLTEIITTCNSPLRKAPGSGRNISTWSSGSLETFILPVKVPIRSKQ